MTGHSGRSWITQNGTLTHWPDGRRRRILAAAGGLLAAPFVRAQARRPYRIGVLPDTLKSPLFIDMMRERGWQQGTDYVVLTTGFKPGPNADSAAKALLAQKPDLIYISNTSYASAAHRLTSTIPIVMLASGYPVEAGLAHSLARPGKNVTGNTVYAGTGVWGKFVELLKEIKPDIRRLVALWSYVPPGHTRAEIDPGEREIHHAARALGIEARIIEIAHPQALPAALAATEAWKAEALLLTSGQGYASARKQVMEFVIEKRLPATSDFGWGIEPPHLIVYSPIWGDLMRQGVAYIDRVLKGADPGELPIQQPAKFEFVVSLKTARAIGLTVPPALLLRADRVIE